MNNQLSNEQLEQQLQAAQETIGALRKRMRQLENHAAQLPLQKHLQSYQKRIAEKSAALEKAENWSELIIKNAMDAIVRLDEQGRIQSWNPMAEKIFGYNESEVLGLLIEDILLPKQLHAANLNYFHKYLKRGRDAWNQRIEAMAQCKDGSELPIEFISSVVNQSGTPAYAMVFRDISDRKAAEQKLRDSHTNLERMVQARTDEVRELAAIVEATNNFVGIADLEGHVIYVNPAGRSMVGLDHEADLNDLSFVNFHSPETCKLLVEDILPQALALGVFETACEFVDKQGKLIPTSSTFMSLPAQAEESSSRLAIIARDLRPEIALQKQVEHVDRLESLGVLAGGIAHDFNNILTAIIGNTGLAKRKIDAYSPAQEYLESIEKSSLQAANLCKQMLAYSGKGNFVIQPTNLSKLITEMHSLLKVSIDKNVVLKIDLFEPLPQVQADITQIQQIIMNLVINASEAIDKHSGMITVATGLMHVDAQYLQKSIHKAEISEGRFVFLEVSDSGCGMDAETRKKIFDPFFTTKFTGRGLGMSAVLGIVHAHSGFLNLYSEERLGTTFKIGLPLSKASEILTTEIQNTASITKAEGLILIIDDEESIRELAKVLLADMGYQVLTAVDGRDGVEVFKQNQNSITGVLLDMTMPHMNGEDCYGELRKINPDINVILSSGYTKEDSTARFKGKGLAGFIQKPYLIEGFQDVIRKCFD
ncbi:MAG: PAS domain S-box protein [Mariprofundaceae bacterium]